MRETFGSRLTIILALAGSAIGLGNIWRFPYIVGQNGGAAFIILYLISAVVLCVPIFISESIIGKKTGLSTFGAFEKLAPGTPWKWLGLLTVATPIIILSFYSVVGGWSIEYLYKSLTFSFSDPATSAEGHSLIFGEFISSVWQPLLCLSIFILLNGLIVILGIRNGIERFTKITTPVLFLMVLVIMFFSISLPGSSEGLKYMLKPDFSKVNGETMLNAMGQAFFSLSLGVGCILTYASYMKKEENVVSTSIATAIFDLLFALLSGFAIMPAVFAAGIEPGAGPGLIFETLPYIFSSIGAQMPIVSSLVAILFFSTILFAALTSSVSMLEAGVAYFVDTHKISRTKATLMLTFVCLALGIFCCLRPVVFDFCDKLTSNFLMTLGSLLFVAFVGWRMKKSEVMEELRGWKFIYFLIRWVAPVVILIVFIRSCGLFN